MSQELFQKHQDDLRVEHLILEKEISELMNGSQVFYSSQDEFQEARDDLLERIVSSRVSKASTITPLTLALVAVASVLSTLAVLTACCRSKPSSDSCFVKVEESQSESWRCNQKRWKQHYMDHSTKDPSSLNEKLL